VWAADAPPALDQLPPEERQQLEEAAAAMGIDPAILAERTWQHIRDMLEEEAQGVPAEDALPDAVEAPPSRDDLTPHPNLTGTPQGTTAPDSVSSLTSQTTEEPMNGFWNGVRDAARVHVASLETDIPPNIPTVTQPAPTTPSPSAKVVSTGNKSVTITRADGVTVTRTGARNWRNFNPGNLVYGEFAKQNGAIGSDGRFAVFPDMETGQKAQEALLWGSDKYKGLTLKEAIARYAPDNENDTANYVKTVVKLSGVSADTPMAKIVGADREKVLAAMHRMEGFAEGTETVANGDGDGGILTASLDASAAAINDAVNASRGGGSTLEIAKAYLGYDERNPKQAQALSAFFKKAGGIDLDPATTAWCAAFLNGVLGEAGIKGTGKATAQSFLQIGTKVTTPSAGDIVVFERGPKGGWQGHVGIVVAVNKDGTLEVLGGNQSSDDSGDRGVTVNVKTFSTDRVLGYRRVNSAAIKKAVQV